MADVVKRGIAHGKKVRAAALSQAQLVYCVFRELCQVSVRVRTHFPLVKKRLVRLIAARFAVKNMRKCGLPALGHLRTQRFFVIKIRALWQREPPGFFVIRLQRMRLHEIFDERHGTICVRTDPRTVIEPGNSVRLVASHGNGRARLQ